MSTVEDSDRYLNSTWPNGFWPHTNPLTNPPAPLIWVLHRKGTMNVQHVGRTNIMYGCGEPFLAALLGCAAWVAGNEICLSVWSDLQRVVRTVSSSSPSSKTMPIDPGLSKLTSTGSSSSSDEDSAGAGSAASSSSSNARSTTGGYATPGTPRHGHACTSGPSNMLDIHGAFAVQNPNEGCGRVYQWVCMGPEPCQSCAVSILCLSAQIYTHCSLSSLYFSAVSRFLNLRQRWIGAGGREQSSPLRTRSAPATRLS